MPGAGAGGGAGLGSQTPPPPRPLSALLGGSVIAKTTNFHICKAEYCLHTTLHYTVQEPSSSGKYEQQIWITNSTYRTFATANPSLPTLSPRQMTS